MKIDSKEKEIFYTIQGDRKLYRSDLIGGSKVLLFDGTKEDYYPMAIDIDKTNKIVYVFCKQGWANPKIFVIFKVPYHGGKPVIFMEPKNYCADIMLDNKHNKLYWFSITTVDTKICEDDSSKVSGNELWCTDINNPENCKLLIGTDKGIRAIRRAVIDPVKLEVYWTQNDEGWINDKICKSDLRGEKIENIAWNKSIQDLVVSYPWGISLDLFNKKVYWADINMDWIARTDMNGGKVDPVVKIKVPEGKYSHPTALDLAKIN